MFKKIDRRPFFILVALKSEYKKRIKLNFKLSLLGALVGIFLLPLLAYSAAITPEEIIALTNRERQVAGLSALTANQLLTEAALAKGQAILASQTFKHNIDNKKFSAWVRETGYDYSYVGENLAIDFLNSQSIMEAWKNSALHKKNLLSPYYQEIGLAAVAGKFQGQDTTVVVQIFGSPAVVANQTLTSTFKLNWLNASPNFQTTLDNYRTFRAENLLSLPLINQQPLTNRLNQLTLLTENNNLIIKINPLKELTNAALKNNYLQPESIISSAGLNNFIVQAGPAAIINNFLTIFIALTLIYALVFLPYYRLFKICCKF